MRAYVRALSRRLDVQRLLLAMLPPLSPAWHALSSLRLETLEHFLDLTPSIRVLVDRDPTSVICEF